jgi:hypothetical protein
MTGVLAHKESFFCSRPFGKTRIADIFHPRHEINDAYRIVMNAKKLFACKDLRMKRPWLVAVAVFVCCGSLLLQTVVFLLKNHHTKMKNMCLLVLYL